MSRKIKFAYGRKKLLLYILMGIIASNALFHIFGMVFGAPSIIIGSIALAAADAYSLNTEGLTKAPAVFTRPYLIAMVVEAIMVAASLSILFLWTNNH
jgi:hypothetical protein